ncbi:MAG TPA: helicase-related protein [Longimicrobiales bacterium]|nr:helicase-related protein [Longimicrobiales bacterium]
MLVVVDEAHAFRNPGTRRYRSLAALCRGAEVVLLTATPVNNTLSDLYFQLRLFAGDGSFRDVGVPDLRGAFEAARGGLAARPVLPVLRDVMVRRTRPFLREHYAGAAWPGGEAVRLPRRAGPRAVRYSMDPAGTGVFGDVASVLASLTLAPYRPAAYGLAARAGETPAELVRLTLLKRLESSVVAFRASVARQVRFLESFVDALGRGFLLLPGGRGGPRAGAADGDQLLLEPVALSPCPAGAERARLEADARADLGALRGLLGRLRVGAGAADPKLEALRSLLDELAGRKVVVFTEFRETARYLARALERRGAVGLVDGRGALLGGAPAGRREVVERFAPAANGAPEPPARERVELLIATDVLSEGLNLQDAAHVVSYDLPWNPIRLVQRVGRVDRLGSPHETVFPYHFVPERGLEELLGLLRRLRGKLRAIEEAVPGDDAVLDGTVAGDSIGALERLLAGDGTVLDDLERVDAAPFEAEERLRGLAARVLSEPELERLRRHAGGACRAAVLDPAATRELVLVAGERRGRGVWLVYDPATGLVEEDDVAAAEVIAAALRKDAVAGPPDGGRVAAAERAAIARADGVLRAGESLAGERASRPGAASVAARRLLRGLGRERGRADPELCGRVDGLLAALSRLGEDGDAGAEEAVRRVVRAARSGAAGALAELVEALGTALRSDGDRAVRAGAAGGEGGPFEVRATIELRRGSGAVGG